MRPDDFFIAVFLVALTAAGIVLALWWLWAAGATP